MDIISAMIVGLVQGLTEFLPVSSSAHLIFIQHLLGLSDASVGFDVLLHVGTLVAVFVYFFKDIVLMIYAFFLSLGDLFKGRFLEGIKEEPYKKLAWLVIIATIPVGVVGLLFNDAVTAMFTGITIPAFFLLITGVLLYVSQRMNNGGIDQSNIGLKEAIIMGCGQAIAIMPGLSRSGTTIAAGLFSDLDKEFAARFSFLLSIPAILGAALVQIKDIGAVDANIGAYIAGFIVAAISGYFAIKFLLKLIQEKSLDVFAYYCWIVGAIILIGSFALGW
ncbi:MAG: undecaprenyl-diphosphate phosphatase [Methanobacteriaceae archaeon]|jgi:undecaprenyl-diphosphatase|nr:undecaprenyl-diphosphate phosphatase [Methanobacteriaceae archaeon]